MTVFDNQIEVAGKRLASLRAIAGGRLKADLFGLKAEKAQIRGKLVPFVFAHQAPCRFFYGENDVRGCQKRGYGTRGVDDPN